MEVEADIFGDGHEQLAADLQWRPLDQPGWVSASMTALENDRWRADFPLGRLGRYEFVVEAWLDRFGGFRRDYAKKRDAGVAQPVDAEEGAELVRRACKRASGELKSGLKDVLARLKGADEAQSGRILLEPGLAELMRAADDRPFRLRSPAQFVDAERLQARYASWYELFPRSQTDDPTRHGTFDGRDRAAAARAGHGLRRALLPADPPHRRQEPQGPQQQPDARTRRPRQPLRHRRRGGRARGDPSRTRHLRGLPPSDRRLSEQGLEIALDFAIQCSPDHPWLREHPGWFDWRPDGSIKYAENPPKKYQDIVQRRFLQARIDP